MLASDLSKTFIKSSGFLILILQVFSCNLLPPTILALAFAPTPASNFYVNRYTNKIL